MKTQNRIQLIGYLGMDPIVTKLTDGTLKARMRLATDTFRKDNDGKVQRKVTWHDIVAWEKAAAGIENNFMKGSHVLVEGAIIHRSYLDSTGHTRYVTEVKAYTLMNLDR